MESLLHEVMEIMQSCSESVPEGKYIEFCNKMKEVHDKWKTQEFGYNNAVTMLCNVTRENAELKAIKITTEREQNKNDKFISFDDHISDMVNSFILGVST